MPGLQIRQQQPGYPVLAFVIAPCPVPGRANQRIAQMLSYKIVQLVIFTRLKKFEMLPMSNWLKSNDKSRNKSNNDK